MINLMTFHKLSAYYSATSSPSPEEEFYNNLALAFLIAFPFIVTFGYIVYKRITASAWDNGQFPSDLKYNKDIIVLNLKLI